MPHLDCHSDDVHSDEEESALKLTHLATVQGLRVLAWDGDWLYASRGYTLLNAQATAHDIKWKAVATYQPVWWRHLSASTRLTFRLFRDGFHALAVLPSQHIVSAVPGAILQLAPGENEFRVTHRVLRGTRPLHITASPAGHIFWGEYFDNPLRDEVHIYVSTDSGSHWDVAYTFPRGSVRHVHNIVLDDWGKCLWVLTGDEGDECRILKASFDFKNVETVLSGKQQTRAAALVPASEAIYFSSDTPLESNCIYKLDRRGNLSAQAKLPSSSIYGCGVGEAVFFSTMVEPSTVNPDTQVHVYGSLDRQRWQSLLEWEKDRWPKKLFQFGNAFFPDGNNRSNILALTTIALRDADLQTSLWKID